MKKSVSKAEYIDELNRRLKIHPDFKQGMEFFHYPKPEEESVCFARGCCWEPKDIKHPFVIIANEVQNEFEVLAKQSHGGD